MKRMYRWPSKRRNRQLEKIANEQATLIISELVKRQSKMDSIPGGRPIIIDKNNAISALSGSIARSLNQLRVRD